MSREDWKEIRAILREITESQKELEKSQKKTDEQLKLLRESQKRTDEQLKLVDQQIKETDRHLKETDRHLKETDRQIKETDRQIKETDKQLKKMIGEISDGWGKFVEGLVEPSVRKLFKKRGIKIIGTFQRAEASINGKHLEIDILSIGKDKEENDVVILTEVKSNLTNEYVDKALQNFRLFTKFFPAYKNSKIIGAIAGIRVNEETIKYAIAQGLYVLVPSGDVMQIKNPRNFKPKYFSATT